MDQRFDQSFEMVFSSHIRKENIEKLYASLFDDAYDLAIRIRDFVNGISEPEAETIRQVLLSQDKIDTYVRRIQEKLDNLRKEIEEPVLDTIVNDHNTKLLLKAIFDGVPFDIAIIKLLEEIQQKTQPNDELRYKIDIVNYALAHFGSYRTRFRILIYERIQNKNGLDPDFTIRINIAFFWTMYGISVKKCLGDGLATYRIAETVFFNALPKNLNALQEEAHRETLSSFNTNSREYPRETSEKLKYCLHSLRLNCKPRTKKKNIHRVEKRAHRIMQLYGLKVDPSRFSNARYEVPSQFANGVIKICFNSKSHR